MQHIYNTNCSLFIILICHISDGANSESLLEPHLLKFLKKGDWKLVCLPMQHSSGLMIASSILLI